MATLPFVHPWPGGRIPYIITHPHEKEIREVFDQIHELSPVRFIARTDEPDYVLFKLGDSNIVVNPQWKPPYATSDVLGYCRGISTVILKEDTWLALHEISHVIGLIHEHQRSDRDLYVRIDPNDKDPNWIRLPESVNQGLPYDGSSITHYGLDWQGREAGWINGANPGQQWSKLSDSDIKSICGLYGK